MNQLCVSLLALLPELLIVQSVANGFSGNKIVSLCDDPVIYAADRLLNNIVRLYRGNYYWELKGLPGHHGILNGPHRVVYPGFNPVYHNTSLVTFLSGYPLGWLTRFEGREWWAWDANGYQASGDAGIETNAIPKRGFTAAFHNANKTHPILIGFERENVYYYRTNTDLFTIGLQSVGSRDGYIGGQFGENFPPYVTAAFSYPSSEPQTDGYYVYLFRGDKYCFRAVYREDSTQPCDEWRSNRELFGCGRRVSYETQPDGAATHRSNEVHEKSFTSGDYKNLPMSYVFLSAIAGLSHFFLHVGTKRDFIYHIDDTVSLCEDPVIYAADRLVNNTVRLYRGNYYWELKGLPGDKRSLDGPHRLLYPGFTTVYPNTKLVTILSGQRKGFLTRFEGRTWYAWNEEGVQQWGDHGTNSHTIPKHGLTAVFHNGDETDPMLIGFQSGNVFYYSTETDIYDNGLQNFGNIHGYPGGQFGENFPPDITAAFSYPSIAPETDGYYVYLFRYDKYCFRAAYGHDSTQSCEEWRSNRELFGCDGRRRSSQLSIATESDGYLILEQKTNRTYDDIVANYDDEDYGDESSYIAVRISLTSLFFRLVLIFGLVFEARID